MMAGFNKQETMEVSKEVVFELLKRGADPNLVTDNGNTALSCLCWCRDNHGDETIDVVKLLVAHKADVHIINKYEQNAKQIASQNSKPKIAEYLQQMENK